MVRPNDLKNFIEISSFTSFNIAAKKLEVTQPALSESIKRLEDDLGFKLFYRTKNGVSLTPEGRKTLEKAKTAIEHLSSLGKTDEHTPLSTIVLGCHPIVGSYFIPKLLRQAEEQIHGYKIRLEHDLSRNIQSSIQMGKIDIGVVVNPARHPDLIVKSIASDKFGVWKSRKSKPQKQVIADPDLFQTQSILKKWKDAPMHSITSSSLELIARITNEGGGYGILPERLVRLSKFDLVQVTDAPIYKDEICMIYRPEFGKSTYEQKIAQLIGTAFKAEN